METLSPPAGGSTAEGGEGGGLTHREHHTNSLPPQGGVPPKAGRGESTRYVGLATRQPSPSDIDLESLPPPPIGSLLWL
jgi:hypothetical protein